MTSAVVCRGSQWGTSALNDGWGAGTSPETAGQLARLVADRFHELADEHGANDTWWAPAMSEVQAEVYGQDTDEHGKWDQTHPLPEGVTYDALREQAQTEVWAAFCSEPSPMTEKVNAVLDA